MTVLEAFRLAFGPLPEGEVHGCYIAHHSFLAGRVVRKPTMIIQWRGKPREFSHSLGAWSYDSDRDAFGPNIADRPASAFRGFFGDAYDAVLDQMSTPEVGNESGEQIAGER